MMGPSIAFITRSETLVGPGSIISFCLSIDNARQVLAHKCSYPFHASVFLHQLGDLRGDKPLPVLPLEDPRPHVASRVLAPLQVGDSPHLDPLLLEEEEGERVVGEYDVELGDHGLKGGHPERV